MHTTDPIQPVARGFAVLDTFLDDVEWLSNQDISARTHLPKPTVSRLSQTLTALGYLTYCPRRRKYRLAVAALSLGYAAVADTAPPLPDVRPLMQRLADANGACVALAGRDGLDMALLAACHGVAAPAALGLRMSRRIPIASSPMGWALLACLHAHERNYLLDRMRPRHRRDEWMATQQKIADAQAQIADKSYCLSNGDWMPGITVVAVPVAARQRQPLVLLCAGSTRTLTKATVEQTAAPGLLALAQHLLYMEDGGDAA